MEPGGGHRQRRRPRLFSTVSTLLLLLVRISPPSILYSGASGGSDTDVQARSFTSFHQRLSLPPPSIPNRCFSGDSETSTWARLLHTPLTSPIVSMVRAQGESPLAKTDGCFRNSRSRNKLPDLSLQISIPPPVSVGPRCSIYCISETTTLPGSGFVELWSLDSQRFYSLVQLGKLCFWTSTCPLFPSPAVCHSQALLNFPHTGICNHRLCLPRRDRYNFLRPIIPNIMTKFLVDVGVSHEIDGVPDFVGIVVLSPDLCYRRIGLFKQGDDYHRSMVSLTGPQVSVLFSSLALGVLVNNLRSFEVAKSYKTRICSEVMPESHRRSEGSPMAALSDVENLGRTVPVGLGPVDAFNGLYYQKGFNPSIKNSQKTNYRTDLGFNFTYRVSVRCFISDIFCNVGLTSRRESLDSLNLIM